MIQVQFEQGINPDSMDIISDAFDGPKATEPLVRRQLEASIVSALLAIGGIGAVAINQGIITVTRSDATDAWVTLWPLIDQAIYSVFH